VARSSSYRNAARELIEFCGRRSNQHQSHSVYTRILLSCPVENWHGESVHRGARVEMSGGTVAAAGPTVRASDASGFEFSFGRQNFGVSIAPKSVILLNGGDTARHSRRPLECAVNQIWNCQSQSSSACVEHKQRSERWTRVQRSRRAPADTWSFRARFHYDGRRRMADSGIRDTNVDWKRRGARLNDCVEDSEPHDAEYDRIRLCVCAPTDVNTPGVRSQTPEGFVTS
jgi:hypothetical protein